MALTAHLGVVLVLLNVRQYRSSYSQMWPIVTYVWSYRGMSASLFVCVCLLAMTVSPAKTDEPTQMPFGRQNRVNPGTMH